MPAAPTRQTRHTRPQELADEEVHRGGDEQGDGEEVAENKGEEDAEGARDAVGVGEAPGESGEDEEEGEQVGEGRVGAVPSVPRFWKGVSESAGDQ